MKICKYCNNTKNFNEFGKNLRNKDKFESMCKECHKVKYNQEKDIRL